MPLSGAIETSRTPATAPAGDAVGSTVVVGMAAGVAVADGFELPSEHAVASTASSASAAMRSLILVPLLQMPAIHCLPVRQAFDQGVARLGSPHQNDRLLSFGPLRWVIFRAFVLIGDKSRL